MEEYILDLLRKVENGTINSQEKQILEAWSKEKNGIQIDFESTKEIDWKKFANEANIAPKPVNTRIVAIRRWASIAASVIILLGAAYFMTDKTRNVEVYSDNEVKELILPDNSVITLNKHSFLSYNDDFGKTNRDIELSGSAYFKVEKNKDLPFAIKTTTATTTVLGTAFYLEESEQDSMIHLDVDEGKVSIQVEDNQPHIKIMGEIFTYNKNTGTVSENRIADNKRFWKTKRLVFENAKLEDALKEISEAYEVTLNCKEDISQCRFTSVLEDEKLSDVLEILRITYQAEWIQEGEKTYTLQSPICK